MHEELLGEVLPLRLTEARSNFGGSEDHGRLEKVCELVWATVLEEPRKINRHGLERGGSNCGHNVNCCCD